MTEGFAQVLARWGQQAELEGAQGTAGIRVFLQPVEERQKAAPFRVTPLGTVDDRLWVCLSGTALQPGDVLRWHGLVLYVRSSRPHYVGEELCHWWAVLSEAKEAAE